MTVADIEQVMELWAPMWTAWDRDNVGLQLGDRTQRVSKILLALEITDDVVKEAIRKKIDLILTHHPPLFRPLTSLTGSTQSGRNLLTLAQRKIAVFSAHTNLDFTRDGVSSALARTLGLQNVSFLAPLTDKMAKIVVYVPSDHVDCVANAMSTAGAGSIGNYDSCSFRTRGTGTFRGNRESNPFAGKRNSLERIEETRLEMIAPRSLVDTIVRSIKSVHPYEEVAYDVYPVSTPSANFGMGAFGSLDREVSLELFLRNTKRVLHANQIRFTGNTRRKIKAVAVCAGSGSDLLETAIRAKADVFVTADVRYHTFQSAEGRIALVDAGHWETEHGILEPMRQRLTDAARQSKQKVSVFLTQISTNPVQCI